ncbi:MAG TPA: prepilin-type N-terminal cleavage/methylation domain-containing protein [Stenomitos sp.]
MTTPARPCGGFTLPEVLLSTVVFAIVAAALVGLYALGMRSADRQGRDTQTLANGQRALAMLEKDVIEACEATTVAGIPASASALALRMPRFDADGILVASDDVIVYSFAGNQLLREVRPGAGSALAAVTGQVILDHATGSPVFDYLRDQGTSLVRVLQVQQAEVVRVRLQASASVGTDPDGQFFRGEYRMRNKR